MVFIGWDHFTTVLVCGMYNNMVYLVLWYALTQKECVAEVWSCINCNSHHIVLIELQFI